VTSEPESDPDPRDRLGAAMRALADATVRTGADDAELAAAADQLAAITTRLAAAPPDEHVHDSPYHRMSIVGGTAHPTAAQLHTVPNGDGGVAGTVLLGPAYEGGPGLVHGGVLALLFDHAMGEAVFVAGFAAMTVSLDVRYRAPTPLEVPLTVTAKVARTEGRSVFVEAQALVSGRVTAEASGVFRRLTAANVARIFPAGRVPQGS
jgi:acyl-coenzyme A thioesterase PaaI-like protein